jgi:hypothetical protein
MKWAETDFLDPQKIKFYKKRSAHHRVLHVYRKMDGVQARTDSVMDRL